MWQRLTLLSVLVLAVAAFSFPPPPPGDWEADESGEGDGFGAGFPFGRRHGGRGRWPWPPRPPHHHRRFPPPPPPPPFLRNVSREARKEFFEIFRDHNLTRRELRGKVDEWAQKQGDDIVKSVKDFETKLDNFKKDLKANITQVVNDLPSAIETLGKIYDNEDLTPSQVREQTREALKKLDKKTARAVFAVIFSVFKPPFPPGPPGPPGFGIKDKRIRIMIGGGGPDFGPFGGFGGFGGPGPFGGPFGPGPVRPPPPPPPAPETSTSEGPDDDFFEIFGRPDEENGVDDA